MGHSPGGKLRGGKTVERDRLKILGRVTERQRNWRRSEKKGGREELRQVEEKRGAVDAKRATWDTFLAASPYLPRVLPR